MDVDAASDLSDDEDAEGTAAFLESTPPFPSVAAHSRCAALSAGYPRELIPSLSHMEAPPESTPVEQGHRKKRKRKPK